MVNARVKPVKEYDPHPSIRAAAIPTVDRKGVLLLVGDFAFGAQHQPPQAAMNEVNLTIPAPSRRRATRSPPAASARSTSSAAASGCRGGCGSSCPTSA